MGKEIVLIFIILLIFLIVATRMGNLMPTMGIIKNIDGLSVKRSNKTNNAYNNFTVQPKIYDPNPLATPYKSIISRVISFAGKKSNISNKTVNFADQRTERTYNNMNGLPISENIGKTFY